MLWDELVVGTTGGLWSMGHAGRDVTACTGAVDKARDRYFADAMKIGASCRVREMEGGASCPDAASTLALDRSRGRIDLSRKCTDDRVRSLSDSWDGTCRGVSTVDGLESCLVEQIDAGVAEALDGIFGAGGTGPASADGSCEEALGKAYSKIFKTGLKAISKCERLVARDRETSCPNADTEAAIEKLAEKASRKIGRSCSDADAVALEARGLPDGCAGVSTVVALHECLMGAVGDIFDLVAAPAETEF